jgi:uncharacterized OsmC-like protein
MASAVLTYRNGVDLDTLGRFVQNVRENPTEANTTLRARADWDGGFRSSARVRDFAPTPSDEPLALGGDDSASSPIEQLLAALGNCIAAGYATNAAASGITIDALSVEVEGDLNLQTFLGLAWGNAGCERIRVTVHIETGAPRELVEELHCGVTRTSRVGHTISQPVPLDIRLA